MVNRRRSQVFITSAVLGAVLVLVAAASYFWQPMYTWSNPARSEFLSVMVGHGAVVAGTGTFEGASKPPWDGFVLYREQADPRHLAPAVQGAPFYLVFPLWILILPAVGGCVISFWRMKRHPAGCCTECGYDVRSCKGTRCPECGLLIGDRAAGRASHGARCHRNRDRKGAESLPH